MGEVLVLGAVIGIFYLLSKGNSLVTTPLSSTSKLPSLSSLLKKAAPIAGAGAVAGGTVLGTTALSAGGSLGSGVTAGSIIGAAPAAGGLGSVSGLTATDLISQAPVELSSEGLAGSTAGGSSVVSPTVAGAGLGTELLAGGIGIGLSAALLKPLANFLTGGTANWSAKQWVESRWKLPDTPPLPKYGEVTTLLKTPGGTITAPTNVLGGTT